MQSNKMTFGEFVGRVAWVSHLFLFGIALSLRLMQSARRWIKRKVFRQMVPPLWPPREEFWEAWAWKRSIEGSHSVVSAPIDLNKMAMELIEESPEAIEHMLEGIPGFQREELLRQANASPFTR